MSTNSILSLMTALSLTALPLACAAVTAAPSSPEGSAAASRELALRYFNELWNQGQLETADAIVAPDMVGHVGSVTLHHVQSLKDRVRALRKIYTQSHFDVDAVVAERDAVAVRWTQRATHSGQYLGSHTSGKQVTVTGMNLFRIASGKIAEIWVNSDDLGELQQLGVSVPNGV